MNGSDPALDSALSWFEGRVEEQTGSKPRRTAPARRAMGKLLAKFPPGGARVPLATALDFAYAQPYWATKILTASAFEQHFAALASGAKAAGRAPSRGRDALPDIPRGRHASYESERLEYDK